MKTQHKSLVLVVLAALLLGALLGTLHTLVQPPPTQAARRIPPFCYEWDTPYDVVLDYWKTSHGYVELVDRPIRGYAIVRELYEGDYELVGNFWSYGAAMMEAQARAIEHTDLGTPTPVPVANPTQRPSRGR